MSEETKNPSDSSHCGQQNQSVIVQFFKWLAVIGKWFRDLGPIVAVIEFISQTVGTFRSTFPGLQTSGSQGARETQILKEGTAVLDRTETSTIEGQDVKAIKRGGKGTTHIGKAVNDETIKKYGVKVTHIVSGVDGSELGTVVGTDAQTVKSEGKNIGVIGGKDEQDIAMSWVSQLGSLGGRRQKES